MRLAVLRGLPCSFALGHQLSVTDQWVPRMNLTLTCRPRRVVDLPLRSPSHSPFRLRSPQCQIGRRAPSPSPSAAARPTSQPRPLRNSEGLADRDRAAAAGRPMGEEAKYLETARADRSVWLMKCPPVVSRAWQAASASSSSDAANPNPVVAKVVLSLDLLSNEEPSLQFKMELAQTNTGNTPKSYSLNMFQDFVPMCVFSESNQGKLSCEGKVEHKFDMEPHSDNLVNYGKLCRERTQKYMVKSRQVQVLDNDHGMSMRPMPGMVGLIPSGSKEKKKQTPAKPSDVKRTRRDRTEMENIIFKLFERQPNWALKALVQETDQPEQFLKEILNDLCVYNKRGPNQGTHELKPEYKKSTGDTDAA
ncbi:hypothetical protein C2845_PM08G13420 [Panicum miliaceum]|uniref:Uncharacterized protein n=4 Tax=Panicum sect. Panicum TaxID=2100772 RepID=A0A3L6QYM6_PANMI|nr:hypothetical protein C2845_PM08G13420 [Panicum miliaceum]